MMSNKYTGKSSEYYKFLQKVYDDVNNYINNHDNEYEPYFREIAGIMESFHNSLNEKRETKINISDCKEKRLTERTVNPCRSKKTFSMPKITVEFWEILTKIQIIYNEKYKKFEKDLDIWRKEEIIRIYEENFSNDKVVGILIMLNGILKTVSISFKNKPQAIVTIDSENIKDANTERGGQHYKIIIKYNNKTQNFYLSSESNGETLYYFIVYNDETTIADSTSWLKNLISSDDRFKGYYLI